MAMSRRWDSRELSTENLHLSFTLEVWDRILGLAWYCRQPYSQLLRDLARHKRRALYDENKRPPLKPKDDERSFAGPKNDGLKRKYRHIKVGVEEKAEIVALAQYLGMPYGQMLEMLTEEKRRALYDQGKRPPLKPPARDDSGPKTPRRKGDV
jgi:hypothetical protein